MHAYVYITEFLDDDGDGWLSAVVDEHDGTEAELVEWFRENWDCDGQYTLSFNRPIDLARAA